jgi:branched-chain amino acid transport system ATP-binding protein
VTLLEVDGVSSFYGDFQALFGVSLAVDEGETLAIIGANGAGKSTLLRTICGLLPRSTGRIRLDGRPLDGVPTYRRIALGIVMVPEGRHIFPSLSVEENLLIGAYRRRPGPWNVERVLELFPNLAGMRRRGGTMLSGGEQQALAIGRALMANPRLLLLDEVSLGLAPRVVKQLYRAMPRIAAGGTTLVLVEQDVGQAVAAADRVVCLLEGRVALERAAGETSRHEIAEAYFGVRR